MAIDEQSRHHLHQVLDQRLGQDAAVTLMEHLPPVGWADVATKHDLDALRIATANDIGALRTEMAVRFEAVDHRFVSVDTRFTQVDQRFDEVDRRFAAVDRRFDEVDRRFDEVDRRFDGMDDRFASLERRFDTFGQQIDDRVDRRTARLVWKLFALQTGVLVAAFAAITALAT